MFSHELEVYAQQVWERAAGPLPSPDGLTGDEALLTMLVYGTLPVSDTASVPFETILSYIRHALMLRREIPACRELPEDIFVHFVLYPRVNSEDISDCRPFFYDMLMPRIRGLSPKEAILEVNRWCAEQVTYQASDDRTESPLTAYLSGTGRCGEESAFAVSALRSVGIPARQIYVPFWAHCDDNHAWVEAYADGQWYYLGACEPEPILDRGWFTDASSRAPLACYRRFFDFTAGPMAADACISRQGCCGLYNVIDRYAPASELTIRALLPDGSPAAGTNVTLSVVNMARFCSVADLVTDEAGICRIRIGHVSVHAEIRKAGLCAAADHTVTADCTLTMTLLTPEASPAPVVFDCYAPAAAPVSRTVLTRQQQAENDAVLARCADIRKARSDSYYPAEYDALDSEWQRLLHFAGGNAAELYALQASADEEARALYKAMLLSLPVKDLKDTPARLLRDHLQHALPYRDRPHFVDGILCPRLHLEMLECWRSPILAYFSEEEKAFFRRDPQSIMAYLQANFPEGDLRTYPLLSIQPTASLKLGRTDSRGRDLLFTAVCRTLGIPARIDPADGAPEYWQDNGFHRLSGTDTGAAAELTLIPASGSRLIYGSHFSLARLEENGYVPLDHSGAAAPLQLKLTPGAYRLLTANRLPNGAQLCTLTHFRMAAGEQKTLQPELRKPTVGQMLSSGTLEPFCLTRDDGSIVSSPELLTGKTILIYLDVRKEPTEHILNELIAAADELRRRIREGLKVVCVLHDSSELTDPTLSKALAALPETQVLYDSFTSDAAMLARKLFLEPGVWPLLILTDRTHRGCYGTCGYQVGTMELTLKLTDVM